MIEIKKAGKTYHSDRRLDPSYKYILDINNNLYELNIKIDNLYYIDYEKAIKIKVPIATHFIIMNGKRIVVTPFRELPHDFKLHYYKIYESFNIIYYNP